MIGQPPSLPPEAEDICEEQIETVLAKRVPYAEWPARLKRLRKSELDDMAPRELRFQLVLGLIIAMMALAIDVLAMPEMAHFAFVSKLLTVVPLTAIGLLILPRTQTSLLKQLTCLSIICFGTTEIYISTFATPELAARYSMASAMLLAGAMLMLPLSPRETARFGMIYALCTIAIGFWPNPLNPHSQFNHILVTGLIGVPCWMLAQRYWDISARTYLYGLRDQSMRIALEKSNARLRELSQHDPLTGLANRRHFENEFNAKYQAIDWNRGRTTLLLVDLDRFKQFNDSYGHLAGDQYLRQAAAILNRLVQSAGGVAARYGGEEFIVAVRERRPGKAQRIADAFRKELIGLVLEDDMNKTEPLTASIGLAHASTFEAEPLERIIARADAALYQAKNRGRDRVICADSLAA